MILERLYMENYKQFREPTELLPPEGAIGVAGRNGRENPHSSRVSCGPFSARVEAARALRTS